MNIFKILKNFIINDNQQSSVRWSLYGRVWREFGKPFWKWLALGIVCTIIAAGAEAFAITLVKQMIDEGFIEKNMQILYWIGLQLVIAYTGKGLFGYAKMLAMTKAGLLGITSLRRRLFRHMMTQPISYFHGTHTGNLMNFFTGLATAVLNLITENVIKIVQSVATILMMFGLMLWYAPQMTAVLFFLVPSIIIPIIIITRKRNVLIRTGFGVEAESLTHIAQSIEGIKTIQAFCNEKQEAARMDSIEDNRVKVHFKSTKLAGMQAPILDTVISIGLCIALLVGGYFITSDAMTTGDFTAFLLALTASYQPAKTLTTLNGGIMSGLIASETLFGFLDQKSSIQNNLEAETLDRQPMKVTLDHLGFAYNQLDGNVLHDVSLEVEAGTICAFVGVSGGGKSTIFNLLERFYDPQTGAVLVNGTDIRQYTLESLRQNIATVSQDVFLFNGSIADNIRYGNPGATMEQIEAAAKAANAHDFIMEFPEQYNNYVGERGAMLSGGQKQRIAIARAILKDAPILLLDEATSALDGESEKLIQAALKVLMKGRTTFVIAHRLATVLDADVICVIKNGRIIEQGTDEELYALGAEYKKLKDIQFKDAKENDVIQMPG